MEDCKSAERKHNCLGIAENWHLTLRLARLSLRGGINTPSTECLSSSGMIVNDNNCTVCREVFMLETLKSIHSADHRLLFQSESCPGLAEKALKCQNKTQQFCYRGREKKKYGVCILKQSELTIHMRIVLSHMKRNPNTGQMLSTNHI